MYYLVDRETKEHIRIPEDRLWMLVEYRKHHDLVKADADGWIEWDDSLGAGNPLPERSRCDIMLDGEDDYLNCDADTEDWDGAEMPSIKITHYRPILNAEETEMKQEWSGHQDGLPPVGTHCKYRTGEDAYIVAHHMDGYQAIWSESRDGGELFYGTSDCFEPILTDRDRWIDAALDCDCEPREGMLSRRDFCGALYDAGLAKLPEKTK